MPLHIFDKEKNRRQRMPGRSRFHRGNHFSVFRRERHGKRLRLSSRRISYRAAYAHGRTGSTRNRRLGGQNLSRGPHRKTVPSRTNARLPGGYKKVHDRQFRFEDSLYRGSRTQVRCSKLRRESGFRHAVRENPSYPVPFRSRSAAHRSDQVSFRHELPRQV